MTAARSPGTRTRGRWLADPGLYAYLAEDGFLAYRWHGGSKGSCTRRPEAISARTVRALWAHLASHASMAEKVYASDRPGQPFWWLTRERTRTSRTGPGWMLRVVDPAAAIAGRGFPAASALTVPLRIADETRPANSGRWRLTVAGGAGTLDQRAPALPAASPPAAPVDARAARLRRAVRRDPSGHAARRRAGRRRDGGRRRRAGCRLRRSPYMLDAF